GGRALRQPGARVLHARLAARGGARCAAVDHGRRRRRRIAATVRMGTRRCRVVGAGRVLLAVAGRIWREPCAGPRRAGGVSRATLARRMATTVNARSLGVRGAIAGALAWLVTVLLDKLGIPAASDVGGAQLGPLTLMPGIAFGVVVGPLFVARGRLVAY